MFFLLLFLYLNKKRKSFVWQYIFCRVLLLLLLFFFRSGFMQLMLLLLLSSVLLFYYIDFFSFSSLRIRWKRSFKIYMFSYFNSTLFFCCISPCVICCLLTSHSHRVISHWGANQFSNVLFNNHRSFIAIIHNNFR